MPSSKFVMVKHTIFKSLPQGDYVVKIFHDENNNMDLDIGFFGILLEAFGFSNNASGIFVSPDYEGTKFSITTENKLVHIETQ